jgi:MYXO-CTERM domain-containing protein
MLRITRITRITRRAATAFVTASLLAACSASEPAPAPEGRAESALARDYRAVAERNAVPRDLLVAIAAVEGGLAIPARREVEPGAQVQAAGPLQLRHGKRDTLALGAALMGVSERRLREDGDLALEAGARVLGELLRETAARADDVTSFRPALEELSGYADAPHRADYANRVLGVLERGGRFRARAGATLDVDAHVLPAGAIVNVPMKGAADYAPADWLDTPSTNKWTAGRSGLAVEYIVIHDTEGGWDASVATLQNDPNKSAHYIVGTDGRVAQFVHESDTAWHAGNWFYNQRSVGIEHVGYVGSYQFTAAEYAASAALVNHLIAKFGVKPDRAHVIGHDQIPNGNLIAESAAPCPDAPSACEKSSNYGGAGNHTDPGSWEWCSYMPMIGGECKCDDIWALWNCNHALDGAYRCNAGASGVIERQVCDGPGACEVMALGVPDVCHSKPATPDAGVDANGGDAGGDDAAADADADGDALADAGREGDAAIAAAAAVNGSGGCATGGRGAGARVGLGGALFALFALGALAAIRRRRGAAPGATGP